MINSTPADRLARELNILDEGVAKLGSLISSPKEWLISLGLHVIRIREKRRPAHHRRAESDVGGTRVPRVIHEDRFLGACVSVRLQLG